MERALCGFIAGEEDIVIYVGSLMDISPTGALIKATGVVRVDSLEEPLRERFGPLAVKNFNALKEAFERTVVEEAQS